HPRARRGGAPHRHGATMTVETPMLEQGLFSAVSAVMRHEPGRFSAEIDPEWTIGAKPNGGYLLSMLARAATSTSVHDHVIAASAHYLHSPEPGPVLIETELLRTGRSASQIRARMEQDGRPCVEALITAYPRLIPSLPNGIRVAIMEQGEVRLEPDSMGFAAGRPSGRGELRGWLALPGAEAFDPNALLFAVDAFPPATFDIEFSGWVPTLELTVYVRAVPAPGPVRVLHPAHLIDGR